MPGEKSLWFYGKIYRILFDPSHKEGREVITDLISPNASVLDVGCGTGELAIMIRERKQCKVVGVDLSHKMIEFAQHRNRYDDVIFAQGDATDLSQFKDAGFDYVVTSKMMHEIPPDKGLQIMNELCRLGRRVILFDYNVPLPGGLEGLTVKMIEATFGRDHAKNFRAYLKGDGLNGIMRSAGIEDKICQRTAVEKGRELIVVLKP